MIRIRKSGVDAQLQRLRKCRDCFYRPVTVRRDLGREQVIRYRILCVSRRYARGGISACKCGCACPRTDIAAQLRESGDNRSFRIRGEETGVLPLARTRLLRGAGLHWCLLRDRRASHHGG